MLRIGVTSDVHLDVTPTNREIVPCVVEAAEIAELDVLIICGDVSPSLMHLARFLAAFERLSCLKLFIAGNHDIWVVTPGSTTSWQKYRALDALCEACGFHHLAAGPQVIGDIGFCGTIGWYDFSFRREDHGIPLEHYHRKQWKDALWQDARYARWEMSDPEMAETCVQALSAQFHQLPASVSQIVVVTHHVPFRECLSYRGDPAWDFFRAFMGSASLGEICRSDPRVTHVLFGHTHRPGVTAIGSLLAVGSPVGYLIRPPRKGLAAYAQERLGVLEL